MTLPSMPMDFKSKLSAVITTYSLSEEEAYQLLYAAKEVRERAYAPYSAFKVGAAVLTEDGTIFSGCNVENASFGATVCAERVAIFNAISEGHSSIRAIAVIADYSDPIPPCGICRQVISEFKKDVIVLMSTTNGDIKVASFETLFPFVFEFNLNRE